MKQQLSPKNFSEAISWYSLECLRLLRYTLKEHLYYVNHISWLSQLQRFTTVIPAQAGIQYYGCILDPRLRGGDNFYQFCNWLS